MKITIFNGSPRGENSNTHIIATEFSAGAESAGAEVENIFLVKKKIGHCLGCFNCWIKTPGECVIKDDMAGLLPKLKTSDIIVFAMPLYVDNVTGIMKNFMDRLIPLADPHFEVDKGGESRHLDRHEGDSPKIVVISNCGFPEQSQFQVLRLLFKRIARNMKSEVVGEIYRSGGEILKESNLMLKPLIGRYKKLVRKAGKEIVENGKISEDTAKELEKPIIPPDQYIKAANKHWDKMLSAK